MNDPDQERLEAWLRGRAEVLSADAWDALFPGAPMARDEQMRMASMFRLAGWHNDVGWNGGKIRRVWRKGPDPKAKAPRVKRPDALAMILARLDRIERALGVPPE